MSSSEPRCPICKRTVARPEENSWFPFCSNRCKVVDLSKWLSGDYAIPAREEDEGDESVPGEDTSGSRLH
jgi:endogenous inhibitor of DNA gyrase (YacG/DUF329 family)